MCDHAEMHIGYRATRWRRCHNAGCRGLRVVGIRKEGFAKRRTLEFVEAQRFSALASEEVGTTASSRHAALVTECWPECGVYE